MFYPVPALNIQAFPLLEVSVHQVISLNTEEEDKMYLLFDIYFKENSLLV